MIRSAVNTGEVKSAITAHADIANTVVNYILAEAAVTGMILLLMKVHLLLSPIRT